MWKSEDVLRHSIPASKVLLNSWHRWVSGFKLHEFGGLPGEKTLKSFSRNPCCHREQDNVGSTTCCQCSTLSAQGVSLLFLSILHLGGVRRGSVHKVYFMSLDSNLTIKISPVRFFVLCLSGRVGFLWRVQFIRLTSRQSRKLNTSFILRWEDWSGRITGFFLDDNGNL